MKKFSIWPGVILSIALLTVSIFLTSKIIQETEIFKQEKTKIAEVLDFNERLLNITEAIPMFGDFVWNGRAAEYANSLSSAELHYTEAIDLAWILVAVLGIGFILFVLIYFKNNKWFGLAFGSLTVAIIVLGIGLLTPMLEMEAYKENLSIRLEVNALDVLNTTQTLSENSIVKSFGLDEYVNDGIETLKEYIPTESISFEKKYPDRVYFFYQNKGIFDLVNILWTSGNIPIAIIIGLFSIAVPIIKLLASLFMLLFPIKKLVRFRKVLAYLTKFSMLDVMVASSFVTYFSFSQMSTGIETESHVLVGLYFFTAYVVVAIFSGIFIDKLISKRNEVSTELK